MDPLILNSFLLVSDVEQMLKHILEGSLCHVEAKLELSLVPFTGGSDNMF